MYEAKVVTHSIGPSGIPLVSMLWTYPRFIHAEIMTHRDRARNAASSRAIPFSKMQAAITENPVVPIFWGREQSGMQTGGSIPDYMIPHAIDLWLECRYSVQRYADNLYHIGDYYCDVILDGCTDHMRCGDREVKIHKSITNRLTEPWMWITVLMTATEWNNLFRLRCHPDAEIHFQKIAGMARDAISASVPTKLEQGQWHIPFILPEDWAEQPNVEELLKISTARCARISYLTHDGKRSHAKDYELFDRLVQGSGFGHWSPHEHIARAESDPDLRSGPFYGYTQYRKLFATENVRG